MLILNTNRYAYRRIHMLLIWYSQECTPVLPNHWFGLVAAYSPANICKLPQCTSPLPIARCIIVVFDPPWCQLPKRPIQRGFSQELGDIHGFSKNRSAHPVYGCPVCISRSRLQIAKTLKRTTRHTSVCPSSCSWWMTVDDGPTGDGYSNDPLLLVDGGYICGSWPPKLNPAIVGGTPLGGHQPTWRENDLQERCSGL